MKRLVVRKAFCGPVLAVVLSSFPALGDSFSYTGSAQTFIAPVTGLYEIVAYGAQGGAASSGRGTGGLGAEIGGDLLLQEGEILTIDVGGQGGSSSNTGAGGGGTFVVGPGQTALVIAGGGGGANGAYSGQNALTGTSGGYGAGSTGHGGTAGNTGGGGAGFYGSGANSNDSSAKGGSGYPSLAGGGGSVNGGFGGGGGADSNNPGGGGGYSGGGGGFFYGGGGGSYLDTSVSNQVLEAGIESGNGLVTITVIPTTTPEPASYALFACGFMAILLRVGSAFAGAGWRVLHARLVGKHMASGKASWADR